LTRVRVRSLAADADDDGFCRKKQGAPESFVVERGEPAIADGQPLGGIDVGRRCLGERECVIPEPLLDRSGGDEGVHLRCTPTARPSRARGSRSLGPRGAASVEAEDVIRGAGLELADRSQRCRE
jgi:hypothetical protein